MTIADNNNNMIFFSCARKSIILAQFRFRGVEWQQQQLHFMCAVFSDAAMCDVYASSSLPHMSRYNVGGRTIPRGGQRDALAIIIIIII